MPNIRETAPQPNLGFAPTETGIDSIAGAARRLQAYGGQIADTWTSRGNELKSTVADVGQVATDYMDHREISAGAANGAQFMANMNAKWEETAKNADPNDPSVKQKFLDETLSPALDQFKQGFNTEKSQAWSEHFVDSYRNHMFEKTSATMATLAGEATKVNAAKLVNGLASAVSIDPSTHSIDNALAVVDHSLGAMVDSSPNIDVATGARIKGELGQTAKQNIVKAAVSSMITKNPGIDLDGIQKKYGDYINGAEMKMFQKQAQTQAKVDAYHDKSAAIAQRQLDDLNVHQNATDAITKNVSVDAQSGKPIINPKFFDDALEIARKNPNAPSAAATVRTMLDWGESQMTKEGKIVDDPTVRKDLTDRLFDPDHPTTRIDLMKAQTAGKLSDHSFQSMERLVTELEKGPLQGPIWQDTIGAVKGELILSGVGIPGKDINGETNYAKWAQTFIPQYLAAQRAGTVPPNALDVKDPTSMISQSMAPFKRTVQQRVQDYVSTLGGAGGAAPTRNDAMPAIPPPEQRNVGSIYETPRGKMKWTGTGWVSP